MVTENGVKSIQLGNSEIFLHSRPYNEHLKIWKENFKISAIITFKMTNVKELNIFANNMK